MTTFLYNDSELQMDTNFILCIEEQDSELIDTRLFIGYSEIDNSYYVRGKRQDLGNKEFVPYAFYCNSTCDLYDFIECVICPYSRINIILYNFNNLEGKNNDDLTYEFFEEHIDRNYEVVAYDCINLKRKMMKKYLRILKNTYNHNYSS
jgi:hypothetical protein